MSLISLDVFSFMVTKIIAKSQFEILLIHKCHSGRLHALTGQLLYNYCSKGFENKINYTLRKLRITFLLNCFQLKYHYITL